MGVRAVCPPASSQRCGRCPVAGTQVGVPACCLGVGTANVLWIAGQGDTMTASVCAAILPAAEVAV